MGFPEGGADADAASQCNKRLSAMGAMKKIFELMVISALILPLTGPQPASASPTDPDKRSAKQAPASDAFPLTLVDAAGRRVTLDRRPERIVVIGRGPFMTLHLLYMFPEARDRIVGMESRQITVDSFLKIIDPRLPEKTILGANPGPEQVAALKPDLVIMKGLTAHKITPAFDTLGIPVIFLGLETPDLFFADVKTMGMILDNPSRAREISEFYRARLRRFDRALDGVKAQDRPRVLVLEYSTRGGKAAVKVPARSWMQTIQALRAGGRPVWLESTQLTDGWTIVHFEQIAAWDPDKIFMIVWYAHDPAAVIDDIKKDPHWRQLRAVKAGELYTFPSDIIGWDTPEPRWILGMSWMARNMFPDRHKDLNIRDEIFAFFGELYGLDRHTVESGILTKIQIMPGH
jgi:iron complex transport system substrate-binding protein